MHTDHYLHCDSNHHPKEKCTLIKTLIDQVLHICEPQYLGHHDTVLQSSGYSATEMGRAMRLHRSSRMDASKEHQVVCLCQNCIRPHQEVTWAIRGEYCSADTEGPKCLQSEKGTREPLSSYRVPCSYRKVHIGTTKCSIKTSNYGEHKWLCHLGQMQKSAIAEHVLSSDNHTVLYDLHQFVSVGSRRS